MCAESDQARREHQPSDQSVNHRNPPPARLRDIGAYRPRAASRWCGSPAGGTDQIPRSLARILDHRVGDGNAAHPSQLGRPHRSPRTQ
jgi:hypothetical protein